VLGQGARERAQRGVARAVAVGVVELLEVIEVEDDEAEAAARPAVLVGDRGGKQLAKRPPL
jgi:hypothetical protein